METNEIITIEEVGNIYQVHDKMFKFNMRDLKVTRSFIENYLPEEIVDHMDLSTLKVEKNSLIEEPLKEYFMDLIFSVKIDGKNAFIYNLFEHKSYDDKLVSLQLLGYMVQLWKQEITENEIPIIIPVVFYHGDKNWTVSTDFMSMYGEIARSVNKEYIWNYKYILVNLKDILPEEIKGIPQLRAMITLMKYSKEELTIDKVEGIIVLIKDNIVVLRTFLGYIVSVSEIELEELKEVVDRVVSIVEGENIMTTAEKLINQGINQGIEKGIEREKYEVAKKMLGLGADLDFVSKSTGLSIEEIEKIKNEL